MNVTVEDDESNFDQFDLNSIIWFNRLPIHSKLIIVDWNTARFYSIIDLDEHPLKEKAKIALANHLNRLKIKAEGK